MLVPLLLLVVSTAFAAFNVGVGIGDVTGPVAEIPFMGMANPAQRGLGLHTRQYARAFIFESSTSGKRAVYLSLDICMCFQAVRDGAVAKLQTIYGNTYTYDNVMCSGTHTHSGPGGFSKLPLYDLTTLGFHNESYVAIIDGFVEAVQMAHENMVPNAKLYLDQSDLNDAGANRSPFAYLNNPASERAQYKYNYDTQFTTLRVDDANGNPVGVSTIFSTHGTAMNNTNRLVSADNKGIASLLFEQHIEPKSLPGESKFVAAMGSTNLGDVSPNTLGQYCSSASKGGSYTPCDFKTSICKNEEDKFIICRGIGPGEDLHGHGTMIDSTEIIGERQFNESLKVYNNMNDTNLITDDTVDYIHIWTDVQGTVVTGDWTHSGHNETMCYSAIGVSTAAGTTDGQGAVQLGFFQGANQSTDALPIRDLAQDLFDAHPTQDQINCQYPKPIFLPTGNMYTPAKWTIGTIPNQIIRIGNYFLAAVPTEMSTMSGRRFRKTIHDALVQSGIKNPVVVITGLANSYTEYTTTFEEYSIQRYEGGSTLYGPNQLAMYQMKYDELARALISGKPVHSDPYPGLCVGADHQSACEVSLIPAAKYDTVPIGHKFGDVKTKIPSSSYTFGQTVNVTFYGANPRQNLRRGGSFLNVQINNNGNWQTLYTDGSICTQFHWVRPGSETEKLLSHHSDVTILWIIPQNAQKGKYRIQYNGDHMNKDKVVTAFTGTSSEFTVQ